MKADITYTQADARQNLPSVMQIPTALWYWRDAVLQHDRKATDRAIQKATLNHIATITNCAYANIKLSMENQYVWDDVAEEWQEPTMRIDEVYSYQSGCAEKNGKNFAGIRLPSDVWHLNKVTINAERYYQSVLRAVRAYVERKTGHCPKDVRLAVEREDAIQYALDHNIGIVYSDADGETTVREQEGAVFGDIRYVCKETIEEWLSANDELSGRKRFAIVTNMDLFDYHEWDSVCRITGCDLPYSVAYKIICILWENYCQTPLDVKTTEIHNDACKNQRMQDLFQFPKMTQTEEAEMRPIIQRHSSMESKEKTPAIQYFEVEFENDISMCIRGVRKPSVKEATEFCGSDAARMYGVVTDVSAIDRNIAERDFNLEDEDSWPVFGASAIVS